MPAYVTRRVAPDGQNGTLGAALRGLPADERIPARILLSPGVYREKVSVVRANTVIESEIPRAARIVWGDGARHLLAGGGKRGTFRTATLFVDAPRVTLRGLVIENDAGPRDAVGQAIALYADGDGLLAEDCALLGYQDTLFTAPLPPHEIEKNGFIGPKQFAPRIPQRQTYRLCTIRGDVDFIFGGAAAWFDRCDIVSADGRADRHTPFTGFVAAPSTPQGQEFGYVFSRCRFLSQDCPPGRVYLARPWREWGKTVLLNCELGPHIAPAGFDDWQKPLARETACFAEYGCTGPGASGPRAPFARRLDPAQAAALTYERFWASRGGWGTGSC